MSEPICLDEDEAKALRDLFGALATIEDVGLRQDNMIEISRELWRDMVLDPARRLRRITGTAPRLSANLASQTREEGT